MSPNPDPFPSQAPTPSRGKKLLFWLAAFCGFLVLFYAQENWRGKRALDREKQILIAQGEVLDCSVLQPTKVPDAENFLKTPLLESIGYKDSADSPTRRRVLSMSVGAYVQGFGSGRTNDLVGCQEFLQHMTNVADRMHSTDPASALLEAMTYCEPEWNELRNASRRTYAQYPVEATNIFEMRLPGYVLIRALTQDFCMLVSAELALGKTDAAFTDARVVGRLIDALQDQPTLVSAMIRVAIANLYVQAFWEGASADLWNERQLSLFQQHFDSIRLIQGVDRALHVGERNGVLELVERRMASHPWKSLVLSGDDSSFDKVLAAISPRGWVHQNLANYLRTMRECGLTAQEVAELKITPAVVEARGEKLRASLEDPWHRYSPYWTVPAVAIPNFAKAHMTAVRNEAMVQEAILVCALERYRMAHGRYPERLESLSPEYLKTLPHDPIGGGPFHYDLNSQGGFRLYSIGWNGKDDGGKPGMTKEGLPDWSNTEGDWVWPGR